jgi:cytochrome c-type biogenesis protein CcmE
LWGIPGIRKVWLKKYIIGGVILAAAVAYLLYLSFGNAISYYVTVSELFEKGDELYDTGVRVIGEVAEGSVRWDVEASELRFTITEGDESLEVLYNSAAPSGFATGNSILVEGRYDPSGVFRASQIILKCPSKYEPAE